MKKLLLAVIITLMLSQGDTSNFNKFEKCMEVNHFDYSDGECEHCWDIINNEL